VVSADLIHHTVGDDEPVRAPRGGQDVEEHSADFHGALSSSVGVRDVVRT